MRNQTVGARLKQVVTAAGFAVLAGITGISPAAAQDYPERPVRIVLPYGPGGVADITSRMVAERLTEIFGQRFLVENAPGGAGAVAQQSVLNAGPDGYTLTLIGNAGAIRRTLMPNLAIDEGEDFDPISPLAEFTMVLVTAPDSELQTVQDILDFAKENPGEMNIGTVAVGTTQNLAASLLTSVAGIEAAIIPYKNSPDLLAGVQRGDADIAIEIFAAAKASIESEQVRAIAVTGTERSPNLPDVPTVEESGVSPYVVTSWNAFAAPAGTPAEHIEKLNEAITGILAEPEVVERMVSFGMTPYAGPGSTVTDRLDSDTAMWRDVIEQAGIEPKD